MYKNKYLKYKNKYLQLKNEISGGSGKAPAIATNQAYQATRAYANPPVFDERDIRIVKDSTGRVVEIDTGLIDLAGKITKQPIFSNIASYLDPVSAASLSQTQKRYNFTKLVEEGQEQIARQIHRECFSRIPFDSMVQAKGDRTWVKYLHDLVNDRSHKILLIGGDIRHPAYPDEPVQMMVIDNEGTEISWQACKPVNKKNVSFSSYYCQGQVSSIIDSNPYPVGFYGPGGYSPIGQLKIERYDVFSQLAVEFMTELPMQIPHLRDAAMIQLVDRAFAIGGRYEVAGHYVLSDRVFRLDINPEQSNTWIEQEARLITARHRAAAATYQGKIWLAGGRGSDGYLSSVEVFDPLVGSWQAAGNLTERESNIALFVINDELFAAGYTIKRVRSLIGPGVQKGMWVEKRNRQTGAWQLVGELNDGDRFDCTLTACGSTIYFFGGGDHWSTESWNSFNTRTNMWASQQEQYRDLATRRLPRNFNYGQAVCITPDEQLAVLAKYKGQLSVPEP